MPAVTIDVTDDGTAYTVTALPAGDVTGAHPYTARLAHTRPYRSGRLAGALWDDTRLAQFLSDLLATYPEADR